jgi:crossover junction endodeoxyribonuclease RuvC
MTKPFVSLGIDCSATSTGIVVLEANADKPKCLYEKIVAPKTLGIPRCTEHAQAVINAVEKFSPDRIAIEGYGGGGKFMGSIIKLVEVGTLVRFMLHAHEHRWLEPAPTQVKMFALGTGQGKKEQMMMQVFKRWGHEALNNDTADAYVLSCIGLGHAGRLSGMTQKMIEVLGTLKLT